MPHARRTPTAQPHPPLERLLHSRRHHLRRPAQALYRAYDRYSLFEEDVYQTLIRATQFQISDPDPTHLTPLQLQEVIGRTQAALLSQYQEGQMLSNMSTHFPDFNPKFQAEEIAKTRHRVEISKIANGSTPAADVTLQRLKAPGYPGPAPFVHTEPNANQAKWPPQ